MRNAFAKQLTALAKEDSDIVFLSGDIGNRLFNEYKELFPQRFFNCGVAEANMIGVASGLASTGLRPVAYTITPFITARCLEQIRVDICYHNLPVTIVGVGAGLSYAGLGPTHHSLEDIAMLRCLPNMQVVCPGDAHEVSGALKAATKQNSPVYIRLGKKGEPLVHDSPPNFEIGKAIPLKAGNELCILSTGNLLPFAMELHGKFQERGISSSLYSFHTVKPLDQDCLKEVFSKHQLVVSLEEHSVLGGFGSSIAEWIHSQEEMPEAKFLSCGTSDQFFDQAGSQSYAREALGISPDQLFNKVSRAWESRRQVLSC